MRTGAIGELRRAREYREDESQIRRKLKRPFHVLHVIDSLAIGGAERMLVDLANCSLRDGHTVSVCVTRRTGPLAGALADDIRVFELERERRLDVGAFLRLAAITRREGIDLLHVHGRSTFALVSLLKALGLISTPVVFHDHRGIAEGAVVPPWFRILGRRFADAYVGVSRRLIRWAEAAGISSSRRFLMENAMDFARLAPLQASEIRAEFGVAREKLLGIVAAGLRTEKGIDVLLEAIAGSRQHDRLAIVVIGGGRDTAYAAKCHSLRKRLGLEGVVVYAGERPDALSLIGAADFAVIPSRIESGPLVLIEVLASGVPFVATRVGEIADRVFESGIPEFVSPGKSDELGAAIDRLVTLPETDRRRRGEQGRAVASASFDLQRLMPRWYDIYWTAMDGVSS